MSKRFAIKSRPNSWVVRDSKGRFKDWHAKSRSVPLDRSSKAKTVKAGYGHIGDLKKRTTRKVFKKPRKTPQRSGSMGLGLTTKPKTFSMRNIRKVLGR